MANALDEKGRMGTGADQAHSDTGKNKRPFDTSEVSWVPEHDDDDPPYRDWWAVSEEQDDE